MPEDKEPIVLQADEGESHWYIDNLVTVKALGTDTSGAYSFLEVSASAGGGPPLHIHTKEDEAIYIIEGEITFQIGDRTVKASAGSFVLMPKGIPHTFRIETPAKGLIILSPPGFENYFIEAGKLAEAKTLPPPPDEPPDFEKIGAIAAKYGNNVVGPPLGH